MLAHVDRGRDGRVNPLRQGYLSSSPMLAHVDRGRDGRVNPLRQGYLSSSPMLAHVDRGRDGRVNPLRQGYLSSSPMLAHVDRGRDGRVNPLRQGYLSSSPMLAHVDRGRDGRVNPLRRDSAQIRPRANVRYGWEITATAETAPGPPRLCASPMSAPGTCILPARPISWSWMLLIIRTPEEPMGWPHDLSPPEVFTGSDPPSRVSPLSAARQPAPGSKKPRAS